MTQTNEEPRSTSNPDCPACQSKKQHNPEEWAKFHPHAGEGFSAEHGVPRPKK